MKKLLLNICIFGISSLTLIAGTIKFDTLPDVKGNIIRFIYEPVGNFFLGEELFARLYVYSANETLPIAWEFKLKFDGKNQYEGSFTLPNDKIYFLVAITNGEITDNNSSKYWGNYASLKNEKNAELKAGLTYLGNMPENIDRKIDFKKALEHFKKETEKFPDNVLGQIAYTSLQLDLQKIDFDKYSDIMNNVLKTSYDVNSENVVRAVSRALRTLNKAEEADKLETNFVKANPQSQLAEEKILSELSKLETLEKFSNAVVEYLKKFPASSNRERIFSALVSGYLQTGDYNEIITILNQLDDSPAASYAQVAYSLMNDSVFENIDVNIRIKKAISLMNSAVYEVKGDNLKYKPIYLTKSEWEKRNKIRMAGLLEQYGQILMSVEQHEEALTKYNESLSLYRKEAPIALYENVMELCGILKKPETAYEIGLLALNNDFPSQNIIDDMRVLYKEVKMSNDFESWLIKLINDAKSVRLQKLSYQMLNENIANLDFVNIEGKNVSFEELKGNIIILTFWSNWCDPCNEALIGLDSIAKKYKDYSNIYFASVSLWDNEDDSDKKLKEFFAENKPQFNILIDKNSQSAFEIGVGGLPYVSYIGKEGKLEFVDKGYINLNEFINSATDKIDLLNK